MTDATLSTAAEENGAALKTPTLLWILIMLALFPTLALLGLVMRMTQSNMVVLAPEYFYAVMTLHGVGMVGLWYVAGMAGVSYILTRYVRITPWVNKVAMGFTVTGVAMLIVCTLIGKYGPGWYFLYPLSIMSADVWADWATATFLIAVGILGVGWTLWSLDLLRAIASRYTLPRALCWHMLRGKTEPDVPPVILISTVSVIGALTGLVAAVILLALYAFEYFSGGTKNDALVMKNLVFLFGHLLVNITLYYGVAMVYELIPAYCGRPWKNSRYIAIAWNCVLVLVLLAYFHHLYMDFVQLRWLQVVGQITSYMSSIPAAVMSIFGTLAIVFRSRMQWGLSSLFLFLGVLGWAVGGIGAVVDSTIAVNVLFHNTLWVPAHFHTYFLMGCVLMILGGAYHISLHLSSVPESRKTTMLIVTLMCIGGYGFVMMFYLGGAHSVPRRFATYPEDFPAGVSYASLATMFVAVFLAGLALYTWETGRRCVKALAAK